MVPTFTSGVRAGSPSRRMRVATWAVLVLGAAACTSVKGGRAGAPIARAPLPPPAQTGVVSRAATPVMRPASLAPTALAPAKPARGPAQPAVGGPAPASIRIDERVSAAIDSNPARSSHAMVVTVLDAAGRPLPGQRVEWILSRSPAAVGDIVGADDKGKVNNTFAVTTTNANEERLDAGNNHPHMDASGARLGDVSVGPGQTWITLSSAQEGVTDVLVYVPGIRDGTRNKIFGRAVWADYDVAFPNDVAAVLPDASRELRVAVRKATDGESLGAQKVEAEILDEGPASFRGGARTATATTGSDGTAAFQLENTGGARGTSRVRLTARGTFHDAEVSRSHVVEVRWQKVELECRVALASKTVPVGMPFDAVVSVTNRGDAPASDASLEAELGGALAAAEGTSLPLAIGVIAPGQTVERTVRLVARGEGDHSAALAVVARAAAASARCDTTVSAVQGRLEVLARCEPAQVEAGSQVRFVVEVRNTGRGALQNVAVSGVYPDGVTPKTASTIQIGTLPPGAADAYEFLGLATRGGTFRNSARVTAEGVPDATAECEVRAVSCALEIALACPDWVPLGEAGTFRVKVTNTGDGPATGTVLHVNHGTCLDGGVLDVPLGDIPAGESKTHEWQSVGVQNAKCALTVEAAAKACEARAQCDVEVGGIAALDSNMAEQTVSHAKKGNFKVGEEFLYVLELGNDTGTDQTPELRVVLSLPQELAFVSATTGNREIAVHGPGGPPREGVAAVPENRPPGVVTSNFRLGAGQRVTIEYRVKVVSPPRSRDENLVRVTASIQRATDGAELANETESTTIEK